MMNRLQAAHRIGGRLDIELDNGGTIHLDYSYLTRGPKRGIYRSDNGLDKWKVIGWKEALRIIREHFPRRNNIQCDRKILLDSDIPPGRGHDYIVHCTTTQEHFHCASCEAAEVHTGVYSKLCGKCTEKSDAKRREITNLILNYEGEFAIPFKEIQEWRDQYNGVYDYDDIPRSYREDFHADG